MPVGDGPVAPHVVGVGELGAGAAGGPLEVGGVVADRVLEQVAAAARGGADGDVADEDPPAGPLPDVVPAGEGLAGRGVDDRVQAGRGLVGRDAGHEHVVREPRGGPAGVDHELAGGRLLRQRRGPRAGGAGGGRRDLGGGGRDVGLAGGVPADRRDRARARPVDDEVAADDAQPGERPLVADVGAAVAVGDDVLDRELLAAVEPEVPGRVAGSRLRGGHGGADGRTGSGCREG